MHHHKFSHHMAAGIDSPVAFASWTLVSGVTKFHKYVYGGDFAIQTDHKPLLGLLKEDKLISTLASPRIQRWALTLSNCQYHIRYKPGTHNSNADGLSRLPLATKTLPVAVPGETIFSLSIVSKTPINASRIARLTVRDPVLSRFANSLHSQVKNSRRSAEGMISNTFGLCVLPSSKKRPCRTRCTDTHGRSEENSWSIPGDQDVSFLVTLPYNHLNYNGSDARINTDDETPTIQT